MEQSVQIKVSHVVNPRIYFYAVSLTQTISKLIILSSKTKPKSLLTQSFGFSFLTSFTRSTILRFYQFYKICASHNDVVYYLVTGIIKVLSKLINGLFKYSFIYEIKNESSVTSKNSFKKFFKVFWQKEKESLISLFEGWILLQ